jgi:hypothetical protein
MSYSKEKGVSNMYLASYKRHLLSKLSFFFLSVLLIIQFSDLEARGWGNTQEAFEYEETLWNRVYFDMNGLYMTVFIPNYCGTVLQKGYVSLRGRIIVETAVQDDKVMQGFKLESLLMGGDHFQKMKAPPMRSHYGSKDCVNLSSSTTVSRMMGDNVRYVVGTSFYPGYNPSESMFEFVNNIQEAYPDNLVLPVWDYERFGVLYGVDIFPIDETDTCFWRFLSTNDRLIKMRTNDTNENRRLHFFESIYIHCR